MKMLHGFMMHVIWVLCDVEFDGDTHFYIRHKDNQDQVKSGKILNIKVSFANMLTLSSFVPGFLKCRMF